MDYAYTTKLDGDQPISGDDFEKRDATGGSSGDETAVVDGLL